MAGPIPAKAKEEPADTAADTKMKDMGEQEEDEDDDDEDEET